MGRWVLGCCGGNTWVLRTGIEGQYHCVIPAGLRECAGLGPQGGDPSALRPGPVSLLCLALIFSPSLSVPAPQVLPSTSLPTAPPGSSAMFSPGHWGPFRSHGAPATRAAVTQHWEGRSYAHNQGALAHSHPACSHSHPLRARHRDGPKHPLRLWQPRCTACPSLSPRPQARHSEQPRPSSPASPQFCPGLQPLRITSRPPVQAPATPPPGVPSPGLFFSK